MTSTLRATGRNASSTATALALIATTLVLPTDAQAAAEYCHNDTDGDYVCIEKVYGPRHNRGLVYTVNGNVFTSRINCYSHSYGRTSIAAIACWNYDA